MYLIGRGQVEGAPMAKENFESSALTGRGKLRQSGPSRPSRWQNVCSPIIATPLNISTILPADAPGYMHFRTPARPACHFCVAIRNVLCPSGGHCSSQAARLRPQPAQLQLESFHLAPRVVGPWEKVTERGGKTQGRLAPVASSHEQNGCMNATARAPGPQDDEKQNVSDVVRQEQRCSRRSRSERHESFSRKSIVYTCQGLPCLL
jgi:hypothetical protein